MAAKQANLFPIDVEEIWARWVQSSGWDAEAAEQVTTKLRAKLTELKLRKARIEAEHDALEKELSSLTDRERRAKAHLESAAKQMGKFATPGVLLASLGEAFPPMRKNKQKSNAAPVVESSNEDPTDDGIPVDNEVRASMLRSFVLDTLDHEGMKISDMLKAAPAEGKFTYPELSTMVRAMVKEGTACVVAGRGRGTEYAKPEATHA